MIEQGTVLDIHGSRVTLACSEGEKCQACSSSFCSAKAGRQIVARNASGLELKAGDTVDLYIPTGKTVLAGFMVLIFPLVLFFLAYFIVEKLVAGVPEGLKLLAGLGGLALGFLVSWAAGKIGAMGDMPVITGRSVDPFPVSGDAYGDYGSDGSTSGV